MLPTMAGAANCCVIPEYKFDIERLTELLVYDREKNPSKYSIVLVSEGAMFEGGEMIFKDSTSDAYGHKKLGGIGDLVSEKIKELSPKYNNGRKIETIHQNLGYLVRGGDPDAIDSIVPMAYGNLALDLLLSGTHGRLVVLKKRPLRQRPTRRGHRYQKGRRRAGVLQRRPLSPALSEVHYEATLHYDQRSGIV